MVYLSLVGCYFSYSFFSGSNVKGLALERAGLPGSWEHGITSGVTIWDNYVASLFEV